MSNELRATFSREYDESVEVGVVGRPADYLTKRHLNGCNFQKSLDHLLLVKLPPEDCHIQPRRGKSARLLLTFDGCVTIEDGTYILLQSVLERQ